MQNIPPSKGFFEHPSLVPESFTLICINNQTTHTYSTSSAGPFGEIGKAFGWSMLLRAHAVGHDARAALLNVVKHLQRFIIATGEPARTAADIDHDLLVRFADWLKSEESGLEYRTAASHYRSLIPAVRQWIGREWAAPGLRIPRHPFPELRSAPRTSPSKGYTEEELHQIATCVLSDIAHHESKQYVPTYLGKPEPLNGVAPKRNDRSNIGDKWTIIEYRTWWWEENCKCKRLPVDEIRLLPSGNSFIYGTPYKVGTGGLDKKHAEAALESFYKQIGAGPNYVRRYLTKPEIYLSKWAKFEYMHWYFDNFCQPRWIPSGELRKTHRQFFIALREHHGGIEKFYKRIGLVKQYPTADYLCPYYVGLLLTTTFNPSTIRTLTMDCVAEGVIDGNDSITWTKLRAARTGLSIPASAAAKLAPRNLVEKVLKLTAPFRGKRKHLFALANPKPQRAELPPNKTSFQKGIMKWFARHGFERTEIGESMAPVHAATNFRPAVAKMAYDVDSLAKPMETNMVETFYEVMRRKGISRRSLMKYCSLTATSLGLAPSVVPQIAHAMENKPRTPVLWLHGLECTCCTESFIRSAHPLAKDVVLSMISLDYDDTLMAAAGHQAEAILDEITKKYKGNYILAVEGNPPLNEDGMFCIQGGKPFIEKLKRVAKDCKAVIAWGSCASWGCVQAAKPNPTQATPIHKVITDKPIIKVPGCPPIPEVMTGVITYMLTFDKIPELDRQGRPKMFYSQRIHDKCYRRPHFDAGQFVEAFDDESARKGYCLYKVGCKGPTTYNACSTVQWNEGTSFPIKAGHGCIGCSEDGFWDKGSFYDRITSIQPFGVESNADKVGTAAASIVGAAVAAHAALSVAKRVRDNVKMPEAPNANR